MSFRLLRSLNTLTLPNLVTPRQQGKLDASVHGFQYAVEGFQGVAELVLQRFVADGLQHGLVVFVDEDGHTLPRLLAGTPDHSGEAKGKRAFRHSRAIKLFPFCHSFFQLFVQAVRGVILPYIQVDVQHGAFYPVFLQLLHRQPFKEFLLSLEVGFEGGDEQALAEAPGAA